jgi:DNA-binding LacI/PurR family transcriptional regulator
MMQIGVLAGVSQSTVSRVLSGASSTVRIAEQTRERILQAVADSGFSPNPFARALRGSRTGLLGLIVRDIGDPFFGMAIAAFSNVAHDDGYNVVLGHVRSSADEAIALREVLEMGHCDGAILLGDLRDQTRLLADLVGHRTPLVGVWQGSRARGIPVVNVDNRAGVRMAVQHLIDLGHERIGFLQGGRTGDGIERRDAYLHTMRERGLQVSNGYVQVAENAFGDAAEALNRLLSLSRRPTGVLTSTDVAAIGALKAASRVGLRVPQDLSVVGFDDIPLAEFCIPSLTTIHQPIEQIARASLQQVLSLISGAASKGRRRTLVPTLAARDSTAPPPKEFA